MNAYKLTAYKDEYEVARLYSSPDFFRDFHRQFGKGGRLSISLAPPFLSRIDPRSGRPVKREFGPWIFRAMRYLAKLKGLRGTFADPFGYTQERRMERALYSDYERRFLEISRGLTMEKHGVAVELARLPERIRGFGPVKAESLSFVKEMEGRLLENFPEMRPPDTPTKRLDAVPAAT
jgi:indolepyruvate ferredoxin oxidoreductase